MILTDKTGETLIQSLIQLATASRMEPVTAIVTEMKKGFNIVDDLPKLLKELSELNKSESKPSDNLKDPSLPIINNSTESKK